MARATRRQAESLPRLGSSLSSLQRQGVRPVHVLLDHRHPVVGEVARQLRLHARVVDGHVGGQDQRVAVALLPQAVDHRRHQAQHAAGALEFHQGRPVRVEPVEDLGVDRIGRLDALLVLGLAALRRELGLLGAVELGEGPRHHVPVLELGGVGEGLEQPPADDLEALLGGGRPPGGLHPPDHIAQPVQGLAPAGPAHLHVIRV